MELFNAFNKVSAKDWQAKIEADLKGKDYQETLVWSSKEEIDVQPFYNNSSLSRNISTPLKPNNQWGIREDITITSVEDANKKALLALKGGVNSLCFIGDITSEKDMKTLLKDIQTEIIELHFYTRNITQTANWANLQKGSISFDFLGEQDNKLDELAALTAITNQVKTITINCTTYNTKNSTIIEELAFSISHGVAYLDLLTEQGLTATEIAKKMQFSFSISTNYFFEIAKIRAARILWQQILEQYQVKTVSMNIHAVTDYQDYSEENVASNILRNTTKSMSAIIGGCDSLTVLPHDKDESTIDFANRIARNVQHLLKEEAFFDKVNNPADGSYYIESITQEIAEKAWLKFQDIEAKGWPS